ncbi:MAG: phosphodiesterase/alkaline phosphatase D [Candidatus Hydrogenedentota bacterium]
MFPRDRRRVVIVAVTVLCIASAWAAPSKEGNPRLMQGPMIGWVAPDSATIWVRASGPFECSIEYAEDERFSEPKKTDPVVATKANDYCLTISISGLKPGTRYYYRPYVQGAIARNLSGFPAFSFKTAPAPGEKSKFTVSFGSCARVQQDPVQPIWQAVQSIHPDLFFWVGDNIYGDALDPDILAEEYRKQRDVPAFFPLLHSVPQLAVWDDHDFGLNDHDRTHPGKAEALTVFKQYWPNPAYGTADTPGVFFSYRYGGVDFIFLDCRYHRDPNSDPDTPQKTFLGKGQLAWLQETLKTSTAPFKVITSGSGFNNQKGEGGDSWAAYLHERDALFNFIRDEKVNGVLLLSGDTHYGELNCIPWSEKGGYDLYELVSSPLAQTASSGGRTPEMRIRRPVTNASNAGILEFDMTGDVPTVTLNMINHFGRLTWSPVVIRADELVNGVVSYTGKREE